MKAAATVLSNNILVRAKKEKIEITPMKLQKLLYYVCVTYVKETPNTPISENFEVWKYGPVLPSVYVEFRPYGANPIKTLAKNSKGKSTMVDEDANPILSKNLKYVWGKLKYFPGIELSRLTHQKGSGWYEAFQRDEEIIALEDMLNDTTI